MTHPVPPPVKTGAPSPPVPLFTLYRATARGRFPHPIAARGIAAKHPAPKWRMPLSCGRRRRTPRPPWQRRLSSCATNPRRGGCFFRYPPPRAPTSPNQSCLNSTHRPSFRPGLEWPRTPGYSVLWGGGPGYPPKIPPPNRFKVFPRSKNRFKARCLCYLPPPN